MNKTLIRVSVFNFTWIFFFYNILLYKYTNLIRFDIHPIRMQPQDSVSARTQPQIADAVDPQLSMTH